MTISPHLNPEDATFPGDASPQPPFGLRDSIRSLALWGVGVPHLAAWAGFVTAVSKISDARQVDRAIKFMTKAVPKLAGVKIEIENRDLVDPEETYVYVVNHVNIFDMFAIYQAIPHYTRSLEHVEHFSWPVFGAFITAAGQIPVDPEDPRLTAKGLRKATAMLKEGDSLVVLPEGQRTLDGTVGKFYPGAFRLAIKAKVPVVPMAIHGGRTVSRRGDWRMRPGKMKISFQEPIAVDGLNLKDVDDLSQRSRASIIAALQKENEKLRHPQ